MPEDSNLMLMRAGNASFLRRMSNVSDDDKRHRIMAQGRPAWWLRRVEQAMGVRREMISGYLEAIGIAAGRSWRPSEDSFRFRSSFLRRFRYSSMLARDANSFRRSTWQVIARSRPVSVR